MSARVRLTVNAGAVERDVDARRSLSDFLREDLGFTGTHVGCGHDDRRPDAADRPQPAAGGVPRLPRSAVRLLHAGDDRRRPRVGRALAGYGVTVRALPLT